MPTPPPKHPEGWKSLDERRTAAVEKLAEAFMIIAKKMEDKNENIHRRED